MILSYCRKLQEYVNRILHPRVSNLNSEDMEKHCELNSLLAKCYLRLGMWQEELEGITASSIPPVLRYYSAATQHDPNWYKAWHAWACMNFEAVLHHVKEDPIQWKPYCVSAVCGFFRSISLAHGSSLQDTLRLLTLCFDYGYHDEVHEALVDGVRTINVDTWLQVIPQLIARIDVPRPLVAQLIQQLLMDIGRAHPQALVYPLTVASKSSVSARQLAANKILSNMKEHSPNLVQQALMVSHSGLWSLSYDW